MDLVGQSLRMRCTAWMRESLGRRVMRTAAPVKGASIHSVALIAIPTWLIWVGFRDENVNTRSPARMSSLIQSTATPRWDWRRL